MIGTGKRYGTRKHKKNVFSCSFYGRIYLYSLSHVRSTISSIGYLFYIRRDRNAGEEGAVHLETLQEGIGDMERLAVKPYLAVSPKKRLSLMDSRFLLYGKIVFMFLLPLMW